MLEGMVRCDNRGVKNPLDGKIKTKNISAVMMIYSLFTGVCIIRVYNVISYQSESQYFQD